MDVAEVLAGVSGAPWLPARTILLVRAGSHAYGMAGPGSDLDLRGTCVAPRACYLGPGPPFEQAERRGDPDLVVFELRKLVRLAAEANPNVLEQLFVEEEDRLLVHPLGQRLLDARQLFLSRRVKLTLAGYARSQLQRIRGHHRWLVDPPPGPPSRAEHGLPERTLIPADQLDAARAAIQKKLDSWSFKGLEQVEPALRIMLVEGSAAVLAEMGLSADEQWRAAARSVGCSESFVELLDRERRYAARQREWADYQRWQRERNPARAALEARHGYDTKHAAHLVRLLTTCREVLATGVLRVRRHDAAALLAIRDGAWAYEDLLDWAEREDRAMDELCRTSPLPDAPDRAAIERLCVELVAEGLASLPAGA